ncbi:hypothetical protein FHR90_001165 [Endobacter medicaginis]|uniref:Phytoene synthase n=2 Tax=Endobacter medicaginis TaxID=1181271 RepID=A0A839V153_9PROT|nr:squalene/phytoene synthase family protein [Endobacter medicaginis]MBB3173342.1 hypothetical protein [Endobacter medicaginis]MCX5476841.1 hypothetical protein [Endobacter medicaginis]
MPGPALPQFVARLRRDDPDRFFAVLLAPAALRADLALLAAFDLEIEAAARRRTELAGPYPALIRLQWWRDLIEGRTADPNHGIAGPLHAALAQGRVAASDLLAMLDGREAEAEGVPDWPTWHDALRASAGGWAIASARLFGVDRPEHLAPAGIARAIWSIRPDTAFLPAGARFDDLPAAAAAVLDAAGRLDLSRPARMLLLPARAARIRARHTGLAVQASMLRLWLFGGGP